jgi:hypothetical protein
MKKLMVALFIAVSVFVGYAGLLPKTVGAEAQNDSCHRTSGFLGFPTWYEYLDIGPKQNDPCAIIGPKEDGDFSFRKALPRIALALVDIMLRVAGMVAVAYTIFGGFKYMTSQGEPDATKQAQGTVINALIGLAIAILATTIVSFVGSKLWL